MAEDRYDKKRTESSVGTLLADIKELELPLLGYSPEWWEQREREIAEQRVALQAKEEHNRRIERAGILLDNGFPELFVAAALAEDKLADTTAMRVARTFAYLPKKILVLAGGVGAGKTTAATWVALKGQDPRPGFARVNQLERRGRYAEKLDEWLEDRTSLVVDDLGAEYLDGKGNFRSVLDEVIDAFYSNRRTLVMTTNLRPRAAAGEPEQFAERYGERVWSRLNQFALWGDCGTRDLRRDPPTGAPAAIAENGAGHAGR